MGWDKTGNVKGDKGDPAPNQVTGSLAGVKRELTLWTGTRDDYSAVAVKDPLTVYVVKKNPVDKSVRWQTFDPSGFLKLSHKPGDLLIAIVSNSTYEGAPEFPAAGGSVPEWKTLKKVGTGNTWLGIHVAYAIATSSSHTSGDWADAGAVPGYGYFLAVSGQSGVGAVAVEVKEVLDRQPVTVTCPSLTLQDTSGESVLVHFAVLADDATPGRGVATPGSTAGYTMLNQRYVSEDVGGAFQGFGEALFTKDDTTSDGAVYAFTSPAAENATSYAVGSIEIKY